MFDWFQKILGKNPKGTDVEQQSLKEYKDMFNPSNIKDSIVEFKDNHVGDKNYYFNISITPESVDRIEETAIAEKVKDIEKLIEKHKYTTAIGMYKDLLEDYASKSLSANDSFYIFNGILNCYVNINDKANTEKYISKIKALGNVNEIHKFHFLCAVYYINQRESNKALEEINKAVEYKSDYFKAICLKILIEFENNIIDAETAKRQLVDDNDKPITGNGENKENACIFNTLGDIYLLSREYEKAIKYYSKANELIPSPFEKMHIGLAIFFDAVKDAKVGEVIDSKDVDFRKLREANSILGELYNYDDEEIRNVIRKHISSFYMKCLYILRDTTRINMIFNEVKDYCLNEKEEMYRLKAISEAIAGDITDGTFRELGEEDKAWIQIVKMMEEKKYDRVISEVEPYIWAKYKDIEKYHYALLEAYLHQSTDESNGKFEKHYKQLVDLGKESEYIRYLKGLYYEYKGNIAKAESIIKEVAINTYDFHLYFELITFYERHKLEKELGELFNELIDNNHKIIEAEKNIFYRKYFLYLFRNNMLEKAVEVYSTLDREGINDITYSFITAELYYLVGDSKKSTTAFEQHYELTKNKESLFKAMTQHIGCNNIEKADEIIRYLLHNEYPRKAILYAIYSNLELLKNNTEKSYEYAKMALEIDKDNPNSEIHQFYVSRSIRCNKEEGTAYIPEFASLFPRHNKWLKSVKVLETDEDGNEVLTQEIKDFFTSSSKRFNTILTGYSNREIGISILAKMQNQSIPQILDWRNIYGIKATVYQGFIQEVYKEVNAFSNKIIVDAFTLYILAEIGYLRILENLETVYITYSTIESLQQVILTKEDGKVRDILNFVKQSLNVEIVYPDYREISKIDENFLDFFFKDQLDSSIYSYSNKIPYLYSDYFVKGSMAERNEYFIGLVAFIRALLGQSIINKETLSDFIFKLKKNQYEFINFDSEDIYNVAKKSNFVVDDDIKLFFTIDRYSDFPSFAIAYVGFLGKVYGEIERHKFDAYVDLYIDLFDKYVRKTRYYFQTLEVKFPDFEKEMDRLGNKNSLSSIMLFEELGAEVLMKIITNTYEFIRIKAILEGTDGALRYFLYMFKDNDEEYEYYSQKVRKQCNNFFPEEVEIIIKRTKEFEFAKMLEAQKEEKR